MWSKKDIHRNIFILLILFLLPFQQLVAQRIDSTKLLKKENTVKLSANDSLKQIHSPRKAALRSAILPGLGQIYNKKYWKLPIIYGALGVSGGVFFYNLKNYRDTRFAYKVKYNMRVNHTDSALAASIKPNLRPLSEESLRFYRNQFRRDIDYSALFFVLLWGLNVVDATVDAHLKTFDVSPDLSMRIKPGHSELAGTNGLSLVFATKTKSEKFPLRKSLF
jgi:hypothetical protein